MKVLIATPLYPPDIGGPAKYAQEIGAELARRGVEVATVVYTQEGKKLPPGLRHFAYAVRLARLSRGCDFIFTLDTWSAGLPALLIAKLFRKKLVVRIGGDFLWEAYVERTGELVKLSDFYTKRRRHSLTLKERCIFLGTRLLVRRADTLLFNTQWQRALWQEPYGVQWERSAVLLNFYAGVKKEKRGQVEPVSYRFVAAGRGVVFKNLSALGRAFARLKRAHPEAELDTRPLGPTEHALRLAGCRATVVSSVSEVNPNTVWEALSYGKPFICPLDTGCHEQLEGLGFFVDTTDPVALEQALADMLDEKKYAALVKKIKTFSYTHTWGEVVDELLAAATGAVVEPQAKVVGHAEPAGLRVLMLSGDPNLLALGSAAHARLMLQKSVVAQLDVLVWPQVHRLGALWRAARHGAYDVVTTQDPFWRGLLGVLLAYRSGAVLNVQVHADLSAQSWVRRMLARVVLRCADTVRVVSVRVHDALPRHLKAHVSLLPVFVDLEPFRAVTHEPHPRFEKTIIWVGRFEEEKNPLRALEVLSDVRAAGVSAGLIFLGSGSLESTLRRAAHDLGLESWVEFPGWHSPVPYLTHADVVLGTSRAESWGASIVEALAAGVPVVALDVGVAKEAGASVVPPAQLSAKVLEVLRIGARGRLMLQLPDAHAWAEQWRDTLRGNTI